MSWLLAFGSQSWEYPLEKGMATHSSILAWRISWTEEPGGLQSMGSQRVSETTERLKLFGTAVINPNPYLLPIYSLGLRVKLLFLFTKFQIKTKPHKLGHVKMKDTVKRNRVNSLGGS